MDIFCPSWLGPTTNKNLNEGHRGIHWKICHLLFSSCDWSRELTNRFFFIMKGAIGNGNWHFYPRWWAQNR